MGYEERKEKIRVLSDKLLNDLRQEDAKKRAFTRECNKAKAKIRLELNALYEELAQLIQMEKEERR